MSGTFPISSIGTVTAKISSKVFNLASESVSGRTQVRSIGGHRWEFTLVFPPMTRAEFGPVTAFISQQAGMAESFQVTLPQMSDLSGSGSGTVTANGNFSIGDVAVTIAGLSGTLKAGDFVKFSTHSKVYQITADRAGAGSMSIYPPLVAAVTTGGSVTYTQVPFTVRLANDVQEFNVRKDMLIGYEVDLIEAI